MRGRRDPAPARPDAPFTYPVRVSDDGTMSIAATSGEDGGRTNSVPSDAWTLAAAKGDRSIAVCIPARNEAATVGPIVDDIVTTLTERTGGAPLVDDVIGEEMT